MSPHDHPDHDRKPPAGGGDRDAASSRPDAALRRIGDALHGLKFGSVLAIVQDGVVVQIERTEKTRFGK